MTHSDVFIPAPEACGVLGIGEGTRDPQSVMLKWWRRWRTVPRVRNCRRKFGKRVCWVREAIEDIARNPIDIEKILAEREKRSAGRAGKGRPVMRKANREVGA